MKKITMLMMAIVMTAGAYAQQFTEGSVIKNPIKIDGTKGIDTLAAPSFLAGLPCSDTLTYYQITNGTLTGNGGFGGTNVITEVGQGFTATGSVTEVLAFVKRASGTAGTITAKIYNTNAGTFVPTGAALKTSTPVQMSSISNTTFDIVKFTFATPTAVTGNFVASLLLPTTAGDTAIVVGTRMGCVVAAQNACAVFNIAGTWVTYNAFLLQNSYESIDLGILAVVNVAGGVSENSTSFSLYPNPANDMFVISSTEKINTIRVFDIFGHLVYENNSAENVNMVNTESFANGAYFVTLETAKGKSTQRLMISK